MAGFMLAVLVMSMFYMSKRVDEKLIREEISGEGLEKLLGETVTLFCFNYIYTGKIIGVNADCVLLTEAGIVYETGGFDEKNWKDMQKLPYDWYVPRNAIESFGKMK